MFAATAGSGVGIDIQDPERLRLALERRPNLATRLFTEGELAYAASRAVPSRHLSARFCAKEAVTKALALPAFAPEEIEILSGGPGARVRLHGSARERAQQLGVEVLVSMSHLKQMTAAIAVATPLR